MCHAIHGILCPQPGIEPVPLAMEVWSLNHWAAKEACPLAPLASPYHPFSHQNCYPTCRWSLSLPFDRSYCVHITDPSLWRVFQTPACPPGVSPLHVMFLLLGSHCRWDMLCILTPLCVCFPCSPGEPFSLRLPLPSHVCWDIFPILACEIASSLAWIPVTFSPPGLRVCLGSWWSLLPERSWVSLEGQVTWALLLGLALPGHPVVVWIGETELKALKGKQSRLLTRKTWEPKSSHVSSVYLLLFLALFPVAWSNREITMVM